MEIEIPGLTPLQQELADRIWACDTPEQVREFFDTLPRNLVRDAYVVYHLILWAFLDQENLAPYTEAREVIEYVRSLPC